METPNFDRIEKDSVGLAARWQNRANVLLTAEEKHIQAQMKRLLTHPMDKVVLTRMIDQCFRSHDNERVADQVNHLLTEYGVPDFFSRVKRLLIQMFLGMGIWGNAESRKNLSALTSFLLFYQIFVCKFFLEVHFCAVAPKPSCFLNSTAI
jgi:hypothetical protein